MSRDPQHISELVKDVMAGQALPETVTTACCFSQPVQTCVHTQAECRVCPVRHRGMLDYIPNPKEN